MLGNNQVHQSQDGKKYEIMFILSQIKNSSGLNI